MIPTFSQLIIIAATNIVPLKQITRKINNGTIIEFQLLLKNKTWESVYKHNDTNNKVTDLCILF
jgi:hypothetical protein